MDRQNWNQRWDELRGTAATACKGIGSEAPLLDAYLYMSRVRCGRPSCKCMRTAYRHPKWCLSFMDDGRSRTLTVPDAWLPRIAKATGAYRKARGLLRQFGVCSQAVTGTASKRIATRVKAGRKILSEMIAAKEKKGGNR